MTNTLNRLLDRVDEAKAKAEAEGYVAPSATYTFTSDEASIISTALAVVGSLLQGEMAAARLMTIAIASRGPEALEILVRVSKDMLEKQCPAFINEIVDETLKEGRETRKDVQ